MLHEVSFASFNGRDQVQGWIYVPACKPKGIVQVIHGFGEHSRRYLHMISAFLDAGYIVAADDHVGHGKTACVKNIQTCHISYLVTAWALLSQEISLQNMEMN